MRLTYLLSLAVGMSLVGQSVPKARTTPAKNTSAAQSRQATPATKEGPESHVARQALDAALNAVNDSWFGGRYQEYNAVDIQGSLNIQVSAEALSQRMGNLTQGAMRGGITQSGQAGLQIKTTWFANSDFRSEISGSFGNLLWTRTGTRGFLYSQNLNSYTTRVDPPPPNPPLTYMSWFRTMLNDIKAVYVNGNMFKASLGREQSIGGHTVQTLVFYAPTGPYDPKKREQSLAETLGFWKRGRLEMLVDKTTRLPYRINYSNEVQGVQANMEFSYDGQKRVQTVTIDNHSKGFDGPGHVRVTYGEGGRMSHISGELSTQQKKVGFNLSLTWAKNRRPTVSVPPPGSTKRSGEDLELALITGVAGNILELQRAGINFRSLSIGK